MAPRWSFGARSLAVLVLLGCESRAAPPESALARYRIGGQPEWRVTLPAQLKEVSGLAVTADGRLFAHGDEQGVVYQVEPRSGKVVKSFELEPGDSVPDLGKKAKDGRLAGDFEDIAIAGDRFFLVTSNGVLLEFAEGADGARVPFTAQVTGLGNVCEVEGLAHDAAADALLLLCKEMARKAARSGVVVYQWSLRDRRLDPRPRLVVPYHELARVTGARQFNGSALALVPGSGSLALVAGPQQAFAQITVEGRAVSGGMLDRRTHPQPEGMAFLPDGTLLVSSEGGRGEATISGYAAR